MQAVITPFAHSPLPAEISLLNHPNADERKKFYFLSDVLESGREDDAPGRIGPRSTVIYDNRSLKEQMRHFIFECVIHAWQQLPCVPLTGTKFNVFKWNIPTDAQKVLFITDIEKIAQEYSTELQSRVSMYGCDFFVDEIVNLAETLRVHKNWNSPAAIVGAAVCNLALILCDCEITPADHDIKHFRLKRPFAKTLTGACYGSRNNVYIEYMTATEIVFDDNSTTGYLNDKTFREEKHDYLVRKNFERTVEPTKYPAPRPTKSTTADWTVRYHGCEVLLGEGKSQDGNKNYQKSLLCAAQQLAFADTGLVLHSSATKFTIYKLRKDCNYFRVSVFDTVPYYLEVQDANYIPINVPIPNYLPKRFHKGWSNLHSAQRGFLMAVFQALEVLSYEFSQIEFDQILENYQLSHNLGLFQEPSFWPSEKQCEGGNYVPINREIKNQEMFVYSPSTMDKLRQEFVNVKEVSVDSQAGDANIFGSSLVSDEAEISAMEAEDSGAVGDSFAKN